ncbi:redoxin domain-containing protein [Plesiocystis pacifica]|uniref:redoxin domain-containing protein n=1 Tax=Plesiocystis pacifica TaxID=191768 RepID=UPI0012F7FFEF|nr:redoxin domain-containing protein [Plesiocystis pacifica]
MRPSTALRRRACSSPLGARGRVALVVGLVLGCAPKAVDSGSEEPTRAQPAELAEVEASPCPDPSVDPRFPDALGPGDSLTEAAPGLELPTADGDLRVEELLGAGPVVLIWLGGAEHRKVIAWLEATLAALPELERRGANVLVARPLAVAGALRWAESAGVQVPVVGDTSGHLRAALGLRGEARDPVERGVWVLGPSGRVLARGLDEGTPTLEALLAVLDGTCPLEG